MKTIYITDCDDAPVLDSEAFDLGRMDLKHCTGCWTCWWKTPGRCVFKDADRFYHAYVTADKAVFIARVSKGFVSSAMKTLFDRMIPLFLPYMDYATGESMHVPRYGRYPDIEFYYEGTFDLAEGQRIFTDYVHRVFYQFHSKGIVIRPLAELAGRTGEGA